MFCSKKLIPESHSLSQLQSAHKSNTHICCIDMDIVQGQPFDEIMFDEMNSTIAMNSPIEKQSRLISTPYDEERAIPATISPCCSQDSAAVFPTVTSKLCDIESHYLIDPTVLGVGHHGSVRRCIHRSTGKQFAVKSICKSDPSVKLQGIAREISLLKELKHRSMIQLVDVYEDSDFVHLVTELCQGGELFDRIVQKSNAGKGCFSEQEAARILYQILNAVLYMQQHNVVHRDIKPENILFETTKEDSSIKIIDFGLARKHYDDRGEPPMTTVVGTPYYIAPDVLQKSYDKSCDLWSIGVIAYILFAGYPPFNGTSNKEVYNAVRNGMYYFPSEDWKHISIGARNFVMGLLQRDPMRRMTVEQALRHPWLERQLRSMNIEDSKDSVEVVYDRSSRKESILFRGLFRPRVKII
ncbi:hypothetical protein ACHAWX_006773 [Stephanocyclus meneghinianus]